MAEAYTGPCKATNPIDRCWRCRQDWADNRQNMAGCARGFGRQAYGAGKGSQIYVVTDPSDDPEDPKPGTLRWGALQEEHLWIVFERDMLITLSREILVLSYKTIDRRGAKVEIAHGAGLTLSRVHHVILSNIIMYDIRKTPGGLIKDGADHLGKRGPGDGDCLSILTSSHIWIDHMSLSKAEDGLVDVTDGSTAITFSNNHLKDHDHTMLLGESDDDTQDRVMQVTLCFNHWDKGLVQRMPRGRYGFVHIVNNDYTEWAMYAIGGGAEVTHVSQGNRFVANPLPHPMGNKEVTKREVVGQDVWSHWNWTTEDDLFVNGAYFVASGTGVQSLKLHQRFDRSDVFKAKPGSFAGRLSRYAGALSCQVGVPC